jgi:hypothetical protein
MEFSFSFSFSMNSVKVDFILAEVFKSSPGRPKCRRDNIKIDIKEIRRESMGWIYLVLY